MSKRASSARAVGPDAATAARQTAHAAAAVRVLVLLRVKIQRSFLPIPLLHGPTGVCGKGKSARQAPVLLRRRARPLVAIDRLQRLLHFWGLPTFLAELLSPRVTGGRSLPAHLQ
jgi:hypothetical protein